MQGTRNLGVVMAVLLAVGLMLVAYQIGRNRGGDAPEMVREVIEERLAPLDGITDRLARLEAQVELLKGGDSAGAGGKTEDSAADEADRLAALEAGVASLDLQVRALEQDPIRRGYAYIESENAELRREGVNILGRAARLDPEARAALRALLADPSARVREQAAQRLGDLRDKESAPEMKRLLGDADPTTRRRAVEGLGAAEARDAVPDLGRTLVSDSDARVREVAAEVLGRLRSAEAAEFLTEALKDRNEAVRARAIDALAAIGATAAAPHLRALYDADPGNQRSRLALALKELGDEGPLTREVGRLSELVRSDPDEQVRGQAIRELTRLARTACRELFTQALEDPSPFVRREAERALR